MSTVVVPRAQRTARVVAFCVAAIVAMSGAIAGLIATADSAHAAGKLTVANEFGKAEADLTYSTTVTVTGSGYQSIHGGFGGIYVVFGWVKSGAWQPSKGGSVGNGDYLYVPDSEDKDNQGFQKFVSFPGSETEGAANGGTIAADGSWRTTMVIPGPTFESVARDGSKTSIDCRTMTCGVLTIGAHGVSNSQNEVFTPIKFATIYSGQPDAAAGDATTDAGESGTTTESATADGADSGTATQDTTADGTTATGNAAASAATVVVDRETAVVGRILAFTATGFLEGEQIVAVLDDGSAAVGPLIAGVGGAAAGVLELPALAQPGTHTLKVTGAASGRVASASFPVKVAPEQMVAAGQVTDAEAGSSWWPTWLPSWPIVLFVGLALAIFIATLIWRLTAGRKRAKRPQTTGRPGSVNQSSPAQQPASAGPSTPAGQPGQATPAGQPGQAAPAGQPDSAPQASPVGQANAGQQSPELEPAGKGQ